MLVNPQFAHRVAKGPLRKIQGVSFPRSGHHLLVNLLYAYFSEQPYNFRSRGEVNLHEPLGAWNFAYCDHYHHCQSVPCTNPHVVFQKNHDFSAQMTFGQDADVLAGSPLEPFRSKSDIFWLIQIREPLPAICSYYELTVHQGFYRRWNPQKKCFERRSDCQESWEEFAKEAAAYYKNFMKRWIQRPVVNSLILPYGALVKDPAASLRQAIQLFDPVHPPNDSLIAEVIEAAAIRPTRRRVKDFKYFDPVFFSKLKRFLDV